MSDEQTELPEGDELPREWLEDWTVPDVPRDLSARVMSRMHETPAVSPPLVFAHSRSSTVVATGAAVFAAAAAAAALVISVARPPAPVVHEAPVAAPATEAQLPTPVIVAGDMQVQELGHLVLDVAPGDAKVEIDGIELAGPAPFVATNLPAGKHELRVTREGYKPWVKVIDVPGAELQLPITLVTESPHDKDVRESVEAGKAVGAMVRQMAAEDPPAGTPVPASDPLGGHVSPTKASVVGNLDADIIRRVVRAHINEVRTCYNAGLIRKPSLEGRVAVQFTIGGQGTVTNTQIVDTTISDEEVETCIAKAVKAWKFPKPDGGGSVVVTYPFVLEAG